MAVSQFCIPREAGINSHVQVSPCSCLRNKGKLILLHKKAVSHIINSRALTGEKPCIKKAIHAL